MKNIINYSRSLLVTFTVFALFKEFPSVCQEKKGINLDSLVNIAVNTSLICLQKSVDEIKDRSLYPNQGTKDFKWQLQSAHDWTSGFYPGTLWYAYELSKNEKFKHWAEEWTSGIENEKNDKNTHDMGFRFLCSFGNGYRLAPNDTVTRHYKQILLTAAATSDSRFIPLLGEYPSDWDGRSISGSIPVIVDIMMDLELMMWAAENGGDPKMKERCAIHANKTFLDFVRPDKGTFHVVRYDKLTCKVINKGTLQGDTDSSTWSRGHAWMVYGFTMMYRYTKNPVFLNDAMQLADYFIEHLPADYVSNWDFQSRLDHRDASATAIVASALFELQGYMAEEKKKQYYLSEAENILTSLCQKPYFSEGINTNCLLLHSTQYFHKTENTDVPCIFADYYFLEAIKRYKDFMRSAPPYK